MPNKPARSCDQFLQELHVRREQRESQPQAGATPAESSPAMVEELAQLDLEMARDVPAAPQPHNRC